MKQLGARLVALLLSLSPGVLFAVSVDYQYDELNRLAHVTYGNGTVIAYSYDPAGNRLTRTVSVPDAAGPQVTIASPNQGSISFAPLLAVSGTATDCGFGGGGVASVTVNGIAATGGASTGCDTANWSADVELSIGSNTLDVVAIDNSANANETTKSISVVYLALIVDGDHDGLPDAWEVANGLSPTDDGSVDLNQGPNGDPDLDGFTTGEEYATGTDPQLDTSKPEGVGDIHYVIFRDEFDDGDYTDRWHLTDLSVDALYSLYESGSELENILQRPVWNCVSSRLDSFAAVGAEKAVLNATIGIDGYGTTIVGLAGETDPVMGVAVRFNSDTAPYLQLVVQDTDGATTVDAAVPASYLGSEARLRLAKNGDEYQLIVNGIVQASLTSNALSSQAVRPYIGEDSCSADSGYVSSRIGRIEVLLDRDGDGLAGLYEDKNLTGTVDEGESDPMNPDHDGDGIPDGIDNCVLASNATQFNANAGTGAGEDLYGNACDGDFDESGFVNIGDLAAFKAAFGTADPEANLDGVGIVNIGDLARFKTLFGKPPGPSGLAEP